MKKAILILLSVMLAHAAWGQACHDSLAFVNTNTPRLQQMADDAKAAQPSVKDILDDGVETLITDLRTVSKTCDMRNEQDAKLVYEFTVERFTDDLKAIAARYKAKH